MEWWKDYVRGLLKDAEREEKVWSTKLSVKASLEELHDIIERENILEALKGSKGLDIMGVD